jgi:hypothetical protein
MRLSDEVRGKLTRRFDVLLLSEERHAELDALGMRW